MDQAFLAGRRAHLVNKLQKVRRSLLAPNLPRVQYLWKVMHEIPAIEAALARVDADDYGRCIGCGDPIASSRLLILPDATQCVECQKDQERDRNTADI